jgi:hypothetical protein
VTRTDSTATVTASPVRPTRHRGTFLRWRVRTSSSDSAGNTRLEFPSGRCSNSLRAIASRQDLVAHAFQCPVSDQAPSGALTTRYDSPSLNRSLTMLVNEQHYGTLVSPVHRLSQRMRGEGYSCCGER